MAQYFTTITKRAEQAAVPDDASKRSHHVRSGNGTTKSFVNPHPSIGGAWSTATLFRRMIWLAITGRMRFPDTKPPTVAVRKPTFLANRTASNKLRATWLGHACYYVEFPSGLRVLFDPVFEDRCSPFSWLGPKRFTERPCDIADIPIIDAVVISHSHYDHLSNPTVHEIHKRHPNATFFVGLGLEKWFRSAGINKVTELDWWEDVEMTVTPETTTSSDKGTDAKAPPTPSITAHISCLPSQHTSGRTGFDKDTTLWCSWAVSSAPLSNPTARKSVWFGGDTGYRAVPDLPATAGPADDYGSEHASLPRCPQFAQIGKLRGPFDLGLIPIGAYAPRWLFSPVHANPFDAVEIFRDTACRRAMGIHWGTWALTTEDVLEPPRLLKEALRRRGVAETGVFDVCEIGESREF